MQIPPWRKALPWVLLVISVIGNGFFLTGLWFAKQKYSGGETRLIERADLTDAQAASARTARSGAMQVLRTMADRNRPHYDRFWDEMAKPAPDREVLDRELWAAALGRFEAQRQISDQTSAFLATLAPDQRPRAVEQIRGRDGFLPGLLMWEWTRRPRDQTSPPATEPPPPALPMPPRP